MKTDLDDLLGRLGYQVHPAPSMIGERHCEAWQSNRPRPEPIERPTCGARTRGERGGRPCKAPGNGAGGRCKQHGGKSTGPKTAEGRARIAEAQRRVARERRERKEAEAMRVRIVRRADVAHVSEQRQAAADAQLRHAVRNDVINGSPGVRQAVETFANGAAITFDPIARKFAVIDSAGEFHGFRRDREAAASFAQSLKQKELMP